MNRNYNGVDMMDKKTYDVCTGYDLNQSSQYALEDLAKDKVVIWITNIHTYIDKGILPSGEKYEISKLIGNDIYPYLVVNENGNLFLQPIITLHRVEKKYPKYIFEKSNFSVPVNKTIMGTCELPEHIHASTNYAYINRYRHEYELNHPEKLVHIEDKSKEKFVFTLQQAKEALAKLNDMRVESIEIKL